MPPIPEIWRAAQTVNATTSGVQTDSAITQLANGNILVSWTTGNNTDAGSPAGDDILAQIYDPLGNRIGTEFRLNTASTADDERESQLAALQNGGFVMAYEDDEGTFNQIRLQEYNAAGGLVSSSALAVADSSSSSPNFFDPRIASSSDSSVLVAYQVTNGAVTSVSSKLYNPTTNTYGAEQLLMTSSGSHRAGGIAVLANGNYVVVADNLTTVSGNEIVKIQYCIVNSSGFVVRAATTVLGTDTDGDRDLTPSVAAIGKTGGFVVAFVNEDVGTTDIEFRIYDSAGNETGAGLAGFVSMTSNYGSPVVAGLTDGNFVVVMIDNDLEQIQASYVDFEGNVLGTFAFEGSGDQPEVIDLGDGRFAVSFRDEGGEISMQIMDVRDEAFKATYKPDAWQVGTVGDDVFNADPLADFVRGHDGNDTITELNSVSALSIFGDAGDDTIIARSSIGDSVWDGGAGNDTIDWSNATEFLSTFSLQTGVVKDAEGNIDAMTGFENLIGTDGNDNVTGSFADNTLTGRLGDDTLFGGGGGTDTLIGSGGNDTYVNPTGDLVLELGGALGDAHDLVKSNVSFNLNATPNVEDLTLTGSAAINGIGGNADNIITGNGGANTLNGGGGADTLNGAGGADKLNGGPGDDTYLNPTGDTVGEAVGAPGGLHDKVVSSTGFSLATTANVEDLTLTGTAQINGIGNTLGNVMIGNVAANILNGGGGADTLEGGRGNDTMNGGSQADIFVFGAVNDGADTIEGFETAIDRFDLSAGELFTNRSEAGGSTILTHDGGTIIVAGVIGLSLAAWNGLVLPGARVHAHEDAVHTFRTSAFGHFGEADFLFA